MASSFELFSLEGRIALVTGSSQGIGFALARGLAEHGATVIINGRDRNKVDATVTLLEDEGYNVFASAFDVTDAEEVRVSIDVIEQEIGPLGILVNNAGMQYRARWKISRSRNGSSFWKPIFPALLCGAGGCALHDRTRTWQDNQHCFGTKRTGPTFHHALYCNEGSYSQFNARYGHRLGTVWLAD